ncbi:hypothetical protein chiPu_0022576 [Chiloscyllium punctatum]|uniref:Uncharacterized protein n=1 Tax=Chiloscyllium punctatum TaxID=137246 RepID=A0A401RE08_CHIPU|nr:hypothetical protein [Chiloscyllium punctatum]
MPLCFSLSALLFLSGWAMQMSAFIFVRRNWGEDQQHLSLILDYLCDIKHPLQLLMFPEGTDLTAVQFEKYLAEYPWVKFSCNMMFNSGCTMLPS